MDKRQAVMEQHIVCVIFALLVVANVVDAAAFIEERGEFYTHTHQSLIYLVRHI